MGDRFVYVFQGENARFPAAVYLDKASAVEDISRHSLSGLLTKYPLGCTIFHYMVDNNLFDPKGKDTASYIESFSSVQMDHYHFKGGNLV